MDLFIAKKNNHALSQWSTRCYRLRNCELTQYKKGIDDFKLCKDETIKQRHNLCDIEQISLNPKTPYVLKITIPTKYQSSAPNCVFLKFSNVNANVNRSKKASNEKDRNHDLFTAIYRLMASSSKPTSECLERPLPSNICVALYYLLQKLYKHSETLRTKFIFKESALEPNPKRPKFIEKLYYDLIVNSHRFLSVDDDYDLDPELLSMTLLYTLQHLPTSLFCDSYCKDVTDFIAKTMGDDRDINCLEESNRIGQVKTYLIQKYSARKMEFRKTHGFHLFNRYGFLTILFTLLHHIQSKRCIDATEMTSYDLAVVFAPCLQSKQYLYLCRSEAISKNASYGKKRRDKRYEAEFITMVQVLIHYAPALFPDLRRVKWKVQSLIHCQGQEKMLIRYFNDQYSLHTKNEYYFPSILKKGTNYGTFAGSLHHGNSQKGSSDSDTSSSSSTSSSDDAKDKPAKEKKYIVRVGKDPVPYGLKKQTSYHERPVYHSDLGGSDLSDVMEEEDTKEEGTEEEEDRDEPATKRKADVADDYLQTERSYDADDGADEADDEEDIESDMKYAYPDLSNKKEQIKQAAAKVTKTPNVITQSDIGYTSDNDEDQYPPIYDGEPISEQDLEESSEYKAPEPKQMDTNTNDTHDNVTDFVGAPAAAQDVEDEVFLEQCDACFVVPLMRLFGYTDYYDTKPTRSNVE